MPKKSISQPVKNSGESVKPAKPLRPSERRRAV